MTYAGPSTQSMNLTHMWDYIPHTREYIHPEQHSARRTITSVLETDATLSKFTAILRRSQLYDRYAHPQASCTVFVPVNEAVLDRFLKHMDVMDAQEKVKSSTVDGIIPTSVLQSSPYMRLHTREPRYTITTRTCNNPPVLTLNKDIYILRENIECDNGMIHVVDQFVGSRDKFL